MTRGVIAIVLVLLGSGCDVEDAQNARAEYNRGIDKLTAGSAEQAVKHFMEARNNAGQDGVLRYRAAFNAGIALAAQADGASEEPETAIGLLQQSAAWFRDASRLRPSDNACRENLEKVLLRIQILADQINKGKNSLEARLDRVIEDQRGLRDKLRAADAAAEAGQPLAADEFAPLATEQRTIAADANTVSDLAIAELGLIESKPEEGRSEQDAVRRIQLQNLGVYLQASRSEQSQGRLEMRRLDTKASLTRAAAALESLKRAREQLLDPVAVLRGIAKDQVLLAKHTMVSSQHHEASTTIGEDIPPLPSWLGGARLADRQNFLATRTEELTQRFKAGAEANVPEDADPKRVRASESANKALPYIQDAAEQMTTARSLLASTSTKRALEAEQRALLALSSALEQFGDIRSIIDLAYGDQTRAVTLLTPDDDQTKKLSTEDRRRQLSTFASANIDRLARLQALIADEADTVGEGAAAPGQQPPSPEEMEQKKALYTRAEELRAQAAGELAQLATALVKTPNSALEKATLGHKTVGELQQLFFSIIEHLKELYRHQADTYDQTTATAAADDESKEALLGPLADSETEHNATATSLAAALEKQADALAQTGQQENADKAQQFGEAAQELRSAAAEMLTATEDLVRARDEASAMSVDLSVSTEAIPKALEHLRKALEILEPPQQDEQKQDEQKQDEQKQDEQKQQEEVSRQQAERRLQEARERDEKRRRQQQPQADEPVEKDW